MKESRQESIRTMMQLANRLNNIVVDMQIRKAQLLSRGDTSLKAGKK